MTSLNELTAQQTVVSSDQFVLYSTVNGQTRKASGAAVSAFVQSALTDSVGALRTDLANATDQAKGAAMVGVDGGTVRSVLSDLAAASALRVLSPRPIGFNYYSLVYEILVNHTVAMANRGALLDWISAAGANMVRFSLPVFSSAEYLSLVHSTSSMPPTMLDSNLRATYISAIDTAMAALAARGLKAHVSDFWGQDFLPGALGETRVQAYSTTASATTIYAKSAAIWFFSRYRTHPAFGIYGLGNEYVTDISGVTGPTAAQLGLWFASVADAARSVSAAKIITADILSLAVSNSATRTTLDEFAVTLRTLFAGLDAYCLHIYGSGFNYVGCQVLEDAAFPNSSATDLGWEGLPALLESLNALARADNKPLIIGEFGVPTGEESDSVYDKKVRSTRVMAEFADYALLWNVQDATLAGTIPGQVPWFIAPGTGRADVFSSIATAFNGAKPAVAAKTAGGLKGLKQRLQPKYAFKGTRVADATVKFTSSAAHANSTGYSLLFWLRLDAALNSNEFLFGLNGDNTNGVAVVGHAEANTQRFYFETRSAVGSKGNTVGLLPTVALAEWNHFAFTSEGVNGSAAIRMYLNGVYFRTLPVSGFPTSIVAAFTMFIGGGNTNIGVPASYQDICLAGSIRPQDVWDHMQGEVIPQALVHIRARSNRSAVDLSKNAAAITFGAGVSIVQV